MRYGDSIFAQHEAGAVFVTRKKENARYRARRRRLDENKGDGFKVLDDAEVKLASKGDSKLPIPMRRVRVKRDDGGCSHHQRSQPLGDRDRDALQDALADRAAVWLDQAAPEARQGHWPHAETRSGRR